MAKDKDSQKKAKAARKLNRKKLDISMRAIIDNIVISKTDQWAYFRISNNVYDFLSNDAKVSMALQMSKAFGALMNDRQEPLDLHIITTTTPVDLEAWDEQVREYVQHWDSAPGFEEYMQKQMFYLKEREFITKVTYLGVHLGKRKAFNRDATSFVEAGMKDSLQYVTDWVKSLSANSSGEKISVEEEREVRAREEVLFTTLNTGNLRAQRCTAEELLLVIKRMMYPAMPSPYLEVDHGNRLGPGDLLIEAGHAITNSWNWLKIRQMLGSEDREGFRATLTLSKLPKVMDFPERSFPFMYWLHWRGMPFDSYARLTLLSNDKMMKTLERKKKEHIDARENAAKANLTDAALGMEPKELSEGIEEIHTMSEILNTDKSPWVQGYYYIVVEAESEKLLKEYCTMVRQEFNNIDVLTQWGNGTQASLFLQQMPGDRLRVESHKQITQLDMLSTSGFNYSSDVGDLLYGSEGAS